MHRSNVKRAVVILSLMLLAFGYGLCAASYQMFPYTQLRGLKRMLTGKPSQQSTEHDYYYQDRVEFTNIFHKRADVVMIGDSITQRAEWSEMFENTRVANRGIEGDTTRGILKRLPEILNIKATKAFVMVGLNDFVEGREVDEVVRDYVQILNDLQSAGLKIFVQSTLLCNPDIAVNECKTGVNAKIADLNARLKAFASGNGISYVDLNMTLADGRGLKSELTKDGEHLNVNGYVLWKAAISRYME